jgi:hypothetical protein
VANSLVYLQFGDLRRILPLNVDISFNPYRIIEVRVGVDNKIVLFFIASI